LVDYSSLPASYFSSEESREFPGVDLYSEQGDVDPEQVLRAVGENCC
jgi:hypothetical protein